MLYEREGSRYDSGLVVLVIEPANDVSENSNPLRYGDSTYYPYFTLGENGNLSFHEGDPSQSDPRDVSGGFLHNALFAVSHLYRLLVERTSLPASVVAFNQRIDDQ